MRSLQLSGAAVAFAFALVLLPQAASAATITVNIGDDYFSGKTIDINPGDTVIWTNVGSMAHTVTADNGSFGSGTLSPGQSFTQTFTQSGNYPYYCKFHGGIGGQGMAGLIRVGPGSSQQPIQTVTTPAPQVQQTVVVPNPYATPTVTTSPSVLTQAQSLLAQVVQLQQILASLKGSSSGGTSVTSISSASCPRIGRTLKPGASGDDVTRLQQYLATDPSVYPEGLITGYYGALTQSAVQRWQIKYNIVSSGDTESTGFGQVGPRTAAAIALQCSTASTVTTPPVTTPPAQTDSTIDGFMQVTPNVGDAPLTVSVQTTINSGASCSSALFTLDWGDGSLPQNIPLSLNQCAPLQQTYSHVYQYGGSYIVKLSSGSHQSTATLLINGPQVPGPTQATTTAPTITVTAPTGGQNYTTGQSLAIGWQSTGTIPAGSSVVLDLYDGSGQKVAPADVIAVTSYLSGAVPWVIPTAAGTQSCPAVYPSGLCGVTLATGSYKVNATLYAPSTAGNTFGQVLASDDSGIFTIIAQAAVATTTTGSTAETFTATPVSGAAPLRVTFSGNVSSSDKGWCNTGCFDLLTYGDGNADYVALPISTNSALPYSYTHNYAIAGTYTAILYQGATAGADKVGTPITITASGGQQNTNYTYGPLTIDYVVNGNPYSVTARYDLPTACTGFQLSWGDGSSDIVQTNSTNCAQTPVPHSNTHQYAQDGSYTIDLKRGANLTQDDSIAIVIQNN